MSLCDSYCEPCVYSRVNDQFGLTTCNYINVVGGEAWLPSRERVRQEGNRGEEEND